MIIVQGLRRRCLEGLKGWEGEWEGIWKENLQSTGTQILPRKRPGGLPALSGKFIWRGNLTDSGLGHGGPRCLIKHCS